MNPGVQFLVWCACAIFVVRQGIEFGSALPHSGDGTGPMMLLMFAGVLILLSVLIASWPRERTPPPAPGESDRSDQRL